MTQDAKATHYISSREGDRTTRPLAGVRMLNVEPGLTAAYCARMLTDLGCAVTTMCASTADSKPGGLMFGIEDSPALEQYFFAGQRLLAGLDVPAVDVLAAGADLLLDSGTFDVEAVTELRVRFPSLVIVSINPFGLEGPWVGRPVSEFTIQALCGSAIYRGYAAREPLHAGGRLSEFISGAYAAVAGLAALRRARSSGVGEHVDLSIAEAAFVAYNMFESVHASMAGESQAAPIRSVALPSVEATADGWVGLAVNTPEQFRAYAEMLGHPELCELANIGHPMRREPYREELQKAAESWLSSRTSDDVVRECAERKIPAAPVNSIEDLASVDHFLQRNLLGPGPTGIKVPNPPFLFDTQRLERATSFAESAVTSVETVEAAQHKAVQHLPLSGIRIVDLTSWWAGPCATQLLSALGATVIKVESHTRYDGVRDLTTKERGTPDWWEWSWWYQSVNTDKLGITLDLRNSKGMDVLFRLLQDADMLIENGSPGVLPKLGLDWDDLHHRFPRLTLLRMPGFGLEGPWSEMRAYDPTIAQATGLASLTGYAGGPPISPRGFCDSSAGVHGALAVLAALSETASTGVGHLVESAMSDVIVGLLAAEIVAYGETGRGSQRMTNRGRQAAPQGIYRCRGTEEWIAIAVHSDVQWEALRSVLGAASLDAAELKSLSRRRDSHDFIDEQIARVCSTASAGQLAERLRSAGVPAERVLTPTEALANEQFSVRGFAEEIHHRVVGTHLYPSLPFRFASQREQRWFRRPSPTLGEHNSEILGQVLGLEASEIAALAEQNVIGDRPR